MNVLIKHKPASTTIDLVDDNDLPIDPLEAASNVNNYFATIGPKLASKFPDTPSYSCDDDGSFDGDSLFEGINERSLLTQINKIALHKSSGIEGLSARLIKDSMKIMFTDYTFFIQSQP